MPDELNANLLIIHAAFPHIGKAIESFWGHKEFPEFINNLLADGRNIRVGFPKEVITALFILQQIHAQEFPQFEDNEDDGWMSTSFK
jgi:hypothetical protein